jgi:hypothetical protein
MFNIMTSFPKSDSSNRTVWIADNICSKLTKKSNPNRFT